jgi:hypothetical protein
MSDQVYQVALEPLVNREPLDLQAPTGHQVQQDFKDLQDLKDFKVLLVSLGHPVFLVLPAMSVKTDQRERLDKLDNKVNLVLQDPRVR